ncbi:hypothetical protein HYV11_00660 [Candidatus Dependentiae bacterium]|nr:hypothetical protein [Candidatus Dependentiae bacterium]
MRLLASESYNVAWFKLADFIARGEKERALTVLKLLMHSIQDEAIPYQLEGDILLAFDDDAALDRYHVAANIYKKAGKFQLAISLYEHVSLFKQDERILEALFDVYFLLKNATGMLDTFSRLAIICCKREKDNTILNLFHQYLLRCSCDLHGLLGIRLVRALLLYSPNNKLMDSYLLQTIDLLKRQNQREEIYIFLSQLEGLDKSLYAKAQDYMKSSFGIGV